jgi:signal transduction histidine kinase
LQNHKKKLLIGKQKAEVEKEVKEKRLKALLYAMADGIVVLSEGLKILTHNPAILTQLEVQSDSNAVDTMEKLIGKMNYDSEYLSPGEEAYVFNADLCELLRQGEGAGKNFAPLLYAGKHLECRGCVTKWDENKIMVLTVRDTSNWAQLEKAAKRDSANKTALIRSVSHELRTPVNAIINLCQDLQESSSLAGKDKADVEVLVNASNFLLSMINDLLDYSRILHDKFELMKTRFNLENLMKSCGQLIALQCKHKHVDFTVRYDSQLPKFVHSDENRLKQVILNLLSNAVK